MRKPKKILAVGLSATLAFSLLGVPAFAVDDDDSGIAASAVSDAPLSSEDGASVDEDALDAELEEREEEASSANEIAVDRDDLSTDVPASKEATAISTDDAVEFVYIDKSIVTIGEEQQIVIGFKDESTSVDNASILLTCAGQDHSVTIESSKIVDNAALFVKSFEDDSEALGYMLAELRYEVDGDSYIVDFGATSLKSVDPDDDSETVDVLADVTLASGGAETSESGKAAYAFDVVTEDLSMALAESAEIGEEDVSVLALKDDGTLVASESVEEAVQIADASGASDVGEDRTTVSDAAVREQGGVLVSSEEEAVSDAEIAQDATNPDGSQTVVNDGSQEFAQEVLGDLDQQEGEDQVADSNIFMDIASAIAGFFGGLFGADDAWGDASRARYDYLIVAIDPGHGGSDPGAVGNNLRESDVNLSIAKHLKNELATYTGVSPYLTRESDVYVGLQERVNKAVNVGAHVFVSVHCNSSTSTAVKGAEVWVPNNSSYLNGLHTEGKALGEKILAQLRGLGIVHRGVKTQNLNDGSKYPDGSTRDYYAVIRGSREAGIPGIIVEHAFISNTSDANTYLKNDANRKKLGIADATGIAQQYGLMKSSAAAQNALVSVKSHVANLGWETAVYDRKVSGTVGKNRGIEAFQLNLMNAAKAAGDVTYRSNTSGTWGSWVSNGATSGTTGASKSIQAVEMKLTGNAANRYEIYYRAHVANLGWLGWAKSGQSAGSSGYGYSIEALEVAVVAKGAAAPGSTGGSYMVKAPTLVSYSTHVQDIGWQNNASDGGTAGTTGRSLRLEGIKLTQTTGLKGDIKYRTHIENIGWESGLKSNGQVSGTTGRALRLEAIQISLTGDLEKNYDVYYRVHAQEFGWLGWAKNGQSAGTAGYAYRLEGIQVKLVKKGNAAPGSTATPFRAKYVVYSAHVKNIGWQGKMNDGATAGTTGRNLQLEALRINVQNTGYSGGVTYRTHIKNIGWENAWKSNYAVSGTTGRALQTEALQIKLTGDVANRYDIYYRVHAQNIGWMGWAKNGESAGTEGYAYGLEAIQIKLVTKGGAAPGSTSNAYRNASYTAIMGKTGTSAAQMARYYKAQKKTYPASAYSAKGAPTIEVFCRIVMEEAQAEGVKPEVVFCQAMKETGWLQYGGQVKAEQCNFAGLGATNDGAAGATFKDVRTGIRAQVQHLKAYASKDALKNPCVDPRFDRVTRGCAPYLENLNGKWAVPGNGYGEAITGLIKSLLKA